MSRDKQVEVIARAVVFENDNILLCKVKNADWYFLPGGHVEYGEPVQEALLRELKEECNISNVKVDNMLGIIEHKFPLKDKEQHEINFFFKVIPTNTLILDNQEDHIKYEFVKLENLKDIKVLPPKVKENILDNVNSSQITWTPIEE